MQVPDAGGGGFLRVTASFGVAVAMNGGSPAELVAEATGFSGEIVWDASKPNGQPRRQLDVSRAEQLFRFRAATPLRTGIERTVAWYRAEAPTYAEG